MSQVIRNELILTKEETKKILDSLNSPQTDVLEKRIKFIESLQNIHLKINDDSSMKR